MVACWSFLLDVRNNITVFESLECFSVSVNVLERKCLQGAQFPRVLILDHMLHAGIMAL